MTHYGLPLNLCSAPVRWQGMLCLLGDFFTGLWVCQQCFLEKLFWLPTINTLTDNSFMKAINMCYTKKHALNGEVFVEFSYCVHYQKK